MTTALKLNRRIVIRAWDADQNDIGSPYAVEVGAWPLWADVGDRSGFNSEPFAQSLWQYDYKITVRYEKGRVIGSNYTVDYDGKRLKINSCSPHTEAYRQYMILRCTALDDSTGTGGGGSVIPLPAIRVYNVTPPDGAETTQAAELVGKTIFGAFKDGVSFQIIPAEPFTDKQVTFDKPAGLVKWSVLFNGLDKATIMYVG